MFLRSVVNPDILRDLEGHRVILRSPRLSDFDEWMALRENSRAFLEPWEPAWPSDFLTRAAFKRQLRRYHQEMRNDNGYPFYLFEKSTGEMMGGLTLGHVRRGVTQSGSLGYWMGEPYAGKGYMSDAVSTVLGHAFGILRLHRLEAACLPSNLASIALLEKCGFQREGFARRYLCINGRWQDHLLYAILADDPRPRSEQPLT